MTTKPETTPQSDITGAAVSGAKSDEIERLRARIAELEAGLRWYATDAWVNRPIDPPTSDELEIFGGPRNHLHMACETAGCIMRMME